MIRFEEKPHPHSAPGHCLASGVMTDREGFVWLGQVDGLMGRQDIIVSVSYLRQEILAHAPKLAPELLEQIDALERALEAAVAELEDARGQVSDSDERWSHVDGLMKAGLIPKRTAGRRSGTPKTH